MPQQYLSTDPNAGEPVEQYLSTDPNAGEDMVVDDRGNPVFRSSVEEEADALRPSIGGFLGNVVSSGANFLQGVATPIMHPIETVQGLAHAVANPIDTGRALVGAAGQRYGSIDDALHTAYTDPVGVASDLSLIFGGGATAAKLAGKAGAAQKLGAVAQAANPLAIPAQAAAGVGRAAYGAAINPSRRIRRGFPGAVDEGYARNILPTEGGLARAENALEASAANTQGLLRHADDLGAPGVTMSQIAPSLAPVKAEAGKRYLLGRPDARPEVVDRAAALYRRNPLEQRLQDANVQKQTAQNLADAAFRAQERGAIIKDLDAMGDLKVAQAYRRAIEQNAASVGVHDIAASNTTTQSLIGLAQALEDATNQPSRLTHLMATLGGVGGVMGGGGIGGAVAYTGARLATAKPVMAGAGLLVGKGAAPALEHAQILRALAVIGALAQQEQGERDEEQQGP